MHSPSMRQGKSKQPGSPKQTDSSKIRRGTYPHVPQSDPPLAYETPAEAAQSSQVSTSLTRVQHPIQDCCCLQPCEAIFVL